MRLGTIAALLSLASCTRANIQECTNAADCDYVSGVCTVNAGTGHRWCSFADTTCPSGWRWAEVLTGDGLAGMCVADGPDPDAPDSDARTPCDALITWSAGTESQSSPHDIWSSRMDGSDAHALTDNGVDLVGTRPATWDSTGERIVYQRANTIWVMNAAGDDERPITPGSDSSPAWSPDGTSVAYVHTSGAMVALWSV